MVSKKPETLDHKRSSQRDGLTFSLPRSSYAAANRVDINPRTITELEYGQGAPPARTVVKRLVMHDEAARSLIVRVHGEHKVSTRKLARAIGCKAVEPCKPEVGQRHTSYLIGGTSPLATRKVLPVYEEERILALEKNRHQWRTARLSGGNFATTGRRATRRPGRPTALWPSDGVYSRPGTRACSTPSPHGAVITIK